MGTALMRWSAGPRTETSPRFPLQCTVRPLCWTMPWSLQSEASRTRKLYPKKKEWPRISATLSFGRLLTGVDDVPDRLRAVVGDKQRPILAHRYADRPAPDLAIRRHEARKEVFILSGRMAVPHGDADDLIAGAMGAVP